MLSYPFLEITSDSAKLDKVLSARARYLDERNPERYAGSRLGADPE
jgi:hypothetical protein